MKDSGNPVGSCLAKVCVCCLWCFEKCIAFLNKNAYMDIAITSSNFCPAARRAMQVILENVAAIAILNGVVTIVFYLGVSTVTCLGSYLTWLMVNHNSYFTDPTSELYVQEPVLVTVVAGIISWLIATTFMVVLDTTSDC